MKTEMTKEQFEEAKKNGAIDQINMTLRNMNKKLVLKDNGEVHIEKIEQ